eukprot:10588228-Lingulodinium_polyedra.AAC.1
MAPPKCSGSVGNTPVLPPLHNVSVVTYNTRALLDARPAVQKKKVRFLLKIAARADILCLRETHGGPAEMGPSACALKNLFWIWHCAGTGGTSILVKKKWWDARRRDAGMQVEPSVTWGDADVNHEVFVEGRVHRLALSCGQHNLVLWN